MSLTMKRVITAKIESTYNVDPTPAATDAVLVENFSWANAGLRMHERPAVRNTLGRLPRINGGRLEAFTFDVELKGSGAAGTVPEFGVLLRACGLGETIVASTSVTYAPVSTGFESCTIYLYEDGTLKKLTGCRGTVSLNLEAGKHGMLSFTMTGHISTLTDTAIVTPTYDSTVPLPFINAGFTIDAFAATISSLSMALNNQVATPPSVNATDGYGEIQITGRDITGSIDPEKELVATEDFMGKFEAGTLMALATGVIGSTAGNRYQFTGPKLQYLDISSGDRDGIDTYDLPVAYTEDTGDDEFSLAFT